MGYKIRVYLPFVVDILASVALGFLCWSFLVTNVIYPVAKYDQQLLKSWGIIEHYGIILTALFFISMSIVVYVHSKSLNRLLKPLTWQNESKISQTRGWLQFTPIGIVAVVITLLVFEAIIKWVIFHDPYIVSTVIFNMLIYPVAGYIIGQTLAKIAKILLWEHRNSARIYWDSNKLIRKPQL